MGYFSNIKKSYKLKNNITYYILAAFLLLMVLLDSMGFLGRSEIGMLSRIGYCIILAVSLNLVVGFLGELSLGHAGFMCIGAYIGCYFASYLRTVVESELLVLIISMLIGGIVAAFFGMIVGLPALRLRGDYLAIVTLAFGEIVRNIFNNLKTFGGAKGMGTTTYDAHQLYIITFITVIIVLFLCESLIRSKHGRAITAIRDNEIAAKAMGINVTYYKLFVFTVAAFFAGVAGVIYGNSVSTVRQDYFTYNYSIDYLVMVVLGGMGSMNGSIIAAALITYVNILLQNILTGNLAEIKQPIYAVILIFVVMFNNAPVFKAIREKIGIKKLISSLIHKKEKPEDVRDDEAKWHRIETKINIDEVLSVDVQPSDHSVPDTEDRQKEEM